MIDSFFFSKWQLNSYISYLKVMGGISYVTGGETDKIILCFVSVGHQSMKAWLCIDRVILSCNHKQKNFQHYLLKPSYIHVCVTQNQLI